MNNIIDQLGGVTRLKTNFDRFRSTIQGDPRKQVQDLLDSGKMTQEQFNKYSQVVGEIMKYVK